MKAIHVSNAPNAIGPYSQAVCQNGMMFVSGQIGIDPKYNKLVDGFEKQVEMIFANLSKILEANSLSLTNIVKVSVFIKDIDKFSILNDIYAKYFHEPYPAREVVEISRLPMNADVEISVIAMG